MTGRKLLLIALGCVIVFAIAFPVEGQTGSAICSQEGTWIVPSALSCSITTDFNGFPAASKIAIGRSILPLTTLTAGASDASRPVPAQQQRLRTAEKDRGAAIEELSSSHTLLPNAPSYLSYHPLSSSEKFDLFLQRTSSPDIFLGATFDAGWAQLTNDWPGYGQGMQGFGKRWGAIIADREATSFFGSFLLPTLLHQDPRYFRLGAGQPLLRRLGYALSRVAVTRNDSGHDTFNSSLVMSTLLVKSLSNAYYPKQERGLSHTMNRFGGSLLGSAQTYVIREFLPDIMHKFRKHEPERLKRLETKLSLWRKLDPDVYTELAQTPQK
jgi:hypothetical protein